MKYEIEVKETVEKIITVTIEVEDEWEGLMIANMLEDDMKDVIHPDDVTGVFEKHSILIISKSEGSENASYEIY